MLTSEVLYGYLLRTVQSVHFHILFWLIVIDVLTGYAKATKLNVLDSSIGTNGLIRHALVVFIQVMVGVYSKALSAEAVDIGLCLFFISNYALSVLENTDAIGLKLPEGLRKYFNRMREDYSDKLTDSIDQDRRE